MAMYYADAAIIVTNPEVSSVRDSDRILGMLASKTKKAEAGETIEERLVVTRYSEKRVSSGEMLALDDIKELLGIKVLGVVPESQSVLNASNNGTPVILDEKSAAGQEYAETVKRFLGRLPEYEGPAKKKKGLFRRLFTKEEASA